MRSVVICGSKKFSAEVRAFAADLRHRGILTFEPNFSEPIPELSGFSSDHVRNMIFKGITFEHFEWIRRADICYVLNIDDYCGVSVTLEMGFAFALGKIIVASSKNTGDPCRDALIDFIAPTPKDLFDFLNGDPSQALLR
jgi:hypothetical protein